MTVSSENEKAATPSTSNNAGKGVNPWDALVKGSKCLARSTEPCEDGYYLASAQEVQGDTLVLTWFGYPKLPTFKARRHAVGLLAKVSSHAERR